MTSTFENLMWLLVMVGPLLLLQRWLHKEIQGVILLVTHNTEITIALFSILFLPGVILHESSHFIAARVLGVKTGKLSIIPRPLENGKVQLGYVETVRSDLFRDSIIGAAPLLTGSTFVALAGIYRLGIESLQVMGPGFNLISLIDGIKVVYNSPDFWLWFYLIFTISSTMMPSASDRRAWLPLAVVIVVLLGFVFLVGAGQFLFDKLITPTNFAVKSLVFVLGISVLVHGVLLPPIWIIRRILERLTGYEIN